MHRALRRAARCSSDPVCAMRTPRDPEDFLHGAACHCCTFASETSCEKANRFLDRRFLLDPAHHRRRDRPRLSSAASMTSDPDHPLEHQGPPPSPTDPYAALGAFLTAHEAERLATVLEAGEHHQQRTERDQPDPTSRSQPPIGRRARPQPRRDLGSRAASHRRRTLRPHHHHPGMDHARTPRRRWADSLAKSCDSSTPPGSRSSAPATTSARTPRCGRHYATPPATRTGRHRLRRRHRRHPRQVADHLRGAAVFQTVTLPHKAKPLVSHAKFVIIDHAVVLTTSANFSHNAENSNIELGMLVHDTALAESIEQTMRAQHGSLYERVVPGG